MEKKDILKELNVEKLNICEPDGTVKMTLFNSRNIPSAILDGEDFMPGHRANDGISGAMFYNNHGDECGGLIYGSSTDENGVDSMGMSLTFDKFKQDQVMQLSIQKEGETESYGIAIFDRPDETIKETIAKVRELQATTDIDEKRKLIKRIRHNNEKRMFIGNDVDGLIKVALYDKNGKEAVKLFVDTDDKPYIEVSGKKIDLVNLAKKLR
jgi:hypothetical protein